MRRILHKRLQLEHRPFDVAVPEARGFGCARHPNAMAAVDAVLRELMRKIGMLPAEPLALKHEGARVAAASEVDVGAALAYAQCFAEPDKHCSLG